MQREQHPLLAGVVDLRRETDAWVLATTDTRATLEALFAHLAAVGRELADLKTHRPTLDDVFIAMTGHSLREDDA